jgi:cell division protease FtsH
MSRGRERHAVAIHEACHALVAYRTRQHLEIDIATRPAMTWWP